MYAYESYGKREKKGEKGRKREKKGVKGRKRGEMGKGAGEGEGEGKRKKEGREQYHASRLVLGWFLVEVACGNEDVKL
jgi:hypothetical protein